jgi:hypothetical protein
VVIIIQPRKTAIMTKNRACEQAILGEGQSKGFIEHLIGWKRDLESKVHTPRLVVHSTTVSFCFLIAEQLF